MKTKLTKAAVLLFLFFLKSVAIQAQEKKVRL